MPAVFWEQFPKVFEMAIKTTLGVFALSACILALLAWLFFGKGRTGPKVFAFSLLFFGVAALGYATFRSASELQVAEDGTTSEKTFHNPMYRGVRLDICYTLANDCGQRAAERWCRSEQGFTTAVDFEADSKIGERGIHTKTIGNEEICNATYCTGYRSITCQK